MCFGGSAGGLDAHLRFFTLYPSIPGCASCPLIIIIGSLQPDEIWQLYGLGVIRPCDDALSTQPHWVRCLLAAKPERNPGDSGEWISRGGVDAGDNRRVRGDAGLKIVLRLPIIAIG